MSTKPIIEKYQPLFYPKSIAVFGASETPTKWGFAVLHNLIRHNYEGRIYPVNPKRKTILGIKAYPDISALPEPVDLALVIVPAGAAIELFPQIVAAGTRACFMITSGFGETGAEGERRQTEMAKLAEEAGMLFSGPNGQGLANPRHNFYGMMGSMKSPAGSVGIISQSGNVGASVMNFLSFYGMGASKFISSGNEASIRSEDYLEYMAADDNTRVIFCYIEGTRNGRRWFDKLRAAARQKPVIILKGGATETGAGAAASHTGALAGDGRLFSAAIRQAGAIEVTDLDEVYDILFTVGRMPPVRGKRVGIVTLGGGWGVMAADACARHGLDVPQLPPQTLDELDKLLPPFWSRGNPVDLAAAVGELTILKCARILAGAENIDAVLMMGVGYPSASARSIQQSPFYPDYNLGELHEYVSDQDEKISKGVIKAIAEFNKAIIPTSELALYSKSIPNRGIDILQENGLSVIPSPQRAARVIKKLADYHAFLEGAKTGK